MRGSRIAKYIDEDNRREEILKRKAKKQHCILSKKEDCSKCEYKDNCEMSTDKSR